MMTDEMLYTIVGWLLAVIAAVVASVLAWARGIDQRVATLETLRQEDVKLMEALRHEIREDISTLDQKLDRLIDKLL